MSTEPTTTSNESDQMAAKTMKRIPPNLASMPNEIKAKIVYWIPMISVDDFDCLNRLNLNAQNEGPEIDRIRSKSSGQPVPSAIKSLSLVNRTFYELCRPWLWEKLHLKDYNIKKLENIWTNIIPKHSEHVRLISWRQLDLEVRDSGNILNGKEEDSKWNTEKLSSILPEFFKACKQLEELDIYLHPSSSSTSFLSTERFIEPLSKLKSLTTLSLSAPFGQDPFSEGFLVLILTELNLLRSFTCSRISATTESVSPLGLCLSKLKNLSDIYLDEAECVDSSWSKLNWTGKIKRLGLEDCQNVSIEVLYQLTKCFASTLFDLELDGGTPCIHPSKVDSTNSNSNILSDLLSGKYNFNLPKLEFLYISDEIIPFEFPLSNFLQAFTTDCKELADLSISQSLGITKEFLQKLIRDKVWPKLKKLTIIRQIDFSNVADLKGLELDCSSMGIKLEIDEEEEEYFDGGEHYNNHEDDRESGKRDFLQQYDDNYENYRDYAYDDDDDGSDYYGD